MSASEIRLALVGCPDDTDVYRDIAMRLQGGCITVVVERDVALGRSVAEAVGASIVIDSLETALHEQGTAFDAVVIRMPLPQRQAAACLAAEARKHVFMEAPIAESVSATEAIIDACNRAGVCLAIGGTLRFLPSSQTIMGRLSDGKLGVPGLLRVHRWMGTDSRSWRPLADILFADIDLALWLFSAKPTDVYALSRKGAEHADSAETMPDYVQVHFGFPSGGMAIFDFSTALPPGAGYESLSLIGSNGAAYADDHHNTHLLYRGGNPAALISGQGHLHIVREHQAFVDAVIEGTRPPVTGEDCRAAHQVMDAVLRSLDAGEVLREQGGGYEPVPEN